MRTGLIALYEDQLTLGFGSLQFNEFLEADFRTWYFQENFYKSRMVIGFSLVVMIVMIMVNFVTGNAAEALPVMAKYATLIMFPALLITVIASYFKNKAFYTWCLVFCGLAVGVAGTLVDVQASLMGQGYYFAGQIGWILIIWTMFGLMFLPTAILCATVSLIYIAVAIAVGLSTEEIFMTSFMLLNVNLLGGYSCYKIEFAARRAYLDSQILSQRAERDGLTNLHNRRVFDEHLERVWRQSRREHCQLSIILIDIDFFKPYNDIYGHQAGDDALKAVARVIADGGQRPLDLAARYGGEEFALVLYDPTHEYVKQLCDQLRMTIEGLQIGHQGGATAARVLTVSVGAAVLNPDSQRSLAGAIQMADEALYQAKEAGRNQVVVNQAATSMTETGFFRIRQRA